MGGWMVPLAIQFCNCQLAQQLQASKNLVLECIAIYFAKQVKISDQKYNTNTYTKFTYICILFLSNLRSCIQYNYGTVNTIVIVYIPHISISLTTAEAAISKGDSLDVYMKSVKDKLDKGTMDEVKPQIK